MEKSYIDRYNSYKKSLASLQRAKGRDKTDEIVLSGTAMIYNLTFDLSWKLMSDIIKEEHGIDDYAVGSPKETLKKAKTVGLIDDDIWLTMLNDRNQLVHDYDYLIAEDRHDTILDKYLPVFEKFEKKVEGIVNG